ncbi:hypothetical protein HK098_004670 [Nowakowskiella sp. JEL0407]|nr:hypothetical protein HK098_004670 [Nowakowskiella sp. JEL0407]
MPLTESFDRVVEIWLFYLTPWTRNFSTEEVISDEWIPYIKDNYLFYTQLLQIFVERSLDFDFYSTLFTSNSSTRRNSQLLTLTNLSVPALNPPNTTARSSTATTVNNPNPTTATINTGSGVVSIQTTQPTPPPPSVKKNCKSLLASISKVLTVFSNPHLSDILKTLESALVSFDSYTGFSPSTPSQIHGSNATTSTPYSGAGFGTPGISATPILPTGTPGSVMSYSTPVRRRLNIPNISPSSQKTVKSMLVNSGPLLRQHILSLSKSNEYNCVFIQQRTDTKNIDNVFMLIRNLQVILLRLMTEKGKLRREVEKLTTKNGNNRGSGAKSMTLSDVLNTGMDFVKGLFASDDTQNLVLKRVKKVEDVDDMIPVVERVLRLIENVWEIKVPEMVIDEEREEEGEFVAPGVKAPDMRNNEITRIGREQLKRGERQCSRLQTKKLLTHRKLVKTYEIEFLVKILTRIAEMLDDVTERILQHFESEIRIPSFQWIRVFAEKPTIYSLLLLFGLIYVISGIFGMFSAPTETRGGDRLGSYERVVEGEKIWKYVDGRRVQVVVPGKKHNRW